MKKIGNSTIAELGERGYSQSVSENVIMNTINIPTIKNM
jgi:hypothetical protein